MWIQIYVLKLNMHEKQDLFLLGCCLGSEPKLSSPMACMESPLSKAGSVSSFDAHKMFGVRILC